jgi:hypothetical protein
LCKQLRDLPGTEERLLGTDATRSRCNLSRLFSWALALLLSKSLLGSHRQAIIVFRHLQERMFVAGERYHPRQFARILRSPVPILWRVVMKHF